MSGAKGHKELQKLPGFCRGVSVQGIRLLCEELRHPLCRGGAGGERRVLCETSSASKVEASIEAESCSLDASSASKIILEGSAGTFRADMSSASKLNAEKFSAVNATIDTSSAASASIDCSGKLTASASSGSSVRYSGDCQTSLEKSSGGSIRKL